MEQQGSPVSTSSFMTRATGVFASPGEVFQEVAAAPVQTSSWMLPYIFSLLIAVVFTFVLFNNPSLRQQVLEPQQQTMQKQVEEGKMTQENYDRAVSMMESPPMFFVFGVIGAFVFISAGIFGAALVIWLSVKIFLKAPVPYKKMLEVFGLTSLVGILGAIITLLLMNLFDSVHAALGGSLLVMNHFDQENMGHKLLASLSVFGLWQTVLVGMGIASVAGKPSRTGMGLAFGLFVLWAVVSALLGISGK
jgi:Yip1-like protein